MKQNDTTVSAPVLKLLTCAEVFWAGVSLLIETTLILLASVIEAYVGYDLIDNGDMKTEEELISMHNEILDNEALLLISIACYWISVIFGLIHIHYLQSIINSLFAAIVNVEPHRLHFINLLGRLYYLCYLLYIICLSVLGGTFLFLSYYYNWEFIDTSNDISYTGYYIQLAFLRAGWSSYIIGYLFYGFALSIPFLLLLFRSIENVISSLCCFCGINCNKWCLNLFLGIFIMILYFVTFAATFDWAYNGFWSDDGGSTMFRYAVFLIALLLASWLIYMSKINQLNFINQIISDINNRNDYTPINGNRQPTVKTVV